MIVVAAIAAAGGVDVVGVIVVGVVVVVLFLGVDVHDLFHFLPFGRLGATVS